MQNTALYHNMITVNSSTNCCCHWTYCHKLSWVALIFVQYNVGVMWNNGKKCWFCMKCLVFSQERYIRAQSHKPRDKSMIPLASSSGCDQCHWMTKRAVHQILLAIAWNSSAKFPWSPIVWKMPTCLKTLAFYSPIYSETSRSTIQSGYRTITSTINVGSYLQPSTFILKGSLVQFHWTSLSLSE